jgi:hypothetical protein
MTTGSNTGAASPAARRTEDIALDLMKFVATAANVGAKSGGGTGFAMPAKDKSDDQVTTLLELYTRCREVVEQPTDK